MASAYGNSSDSEEDTVEGRDSNVINSTSGRLPSNFQDSAANPTTRIDRDGVLSKSASCVAHMHSRFGHNLGHQSFDHSVKKEDHKLTSGSEFENTRAVPYFTTYNSPDPHGAEKSLLVKAMVPVNNKNALMVPQCDEDSSRMHVFCLEHAAEAEQQLRPTDAFFH